MARGILRMTSKVFSGVLPALLATAVLMSASAAQASTVLVTNEAAIVNDGLVNWGSLGPDGTITNPFTIPVPGVGGLQMTTSQLQNSFERRNQGNGWGGNFGEGERVLYSDGSNAPMTFEFTDGIAGFGAQIQANWWGDFTAVISAYDASDVLLGTYSRLGVSTGNGDDSAIFIGILSSSADIRKIVLSVPVATGDIQDFALNSPSIQLARSSTRGIANPEPASMILLGTGVAGLIARRLRRRSA